MRHPLLCIIPWLLWSDRGGRRRSYHEIHHHHNSSSTSYRKGSYCSMCGERHSRKYTYDHEPVAIHHHYNSSYSKRSSSDGGKPAMGNGWFWVFGILEPLWQSLGFFLSVPGYETQLCRAIMSFFFARSRSKFTATTFLFLTLCGDLNWLGFPHVENTVTTGPSLSLLNTDRSSNTGPMSWVKTPLSGWGFDNPTWKLGPHSTLGIFGKSPHDSDPDSDSYDEERVHTKVHALYTIDIGGEGKSGWWNFGRPAGAKKGPSKPRWDRVKEEMERRVNEEKRKLKEMGQQEKSEWKVVMNRKGWFGRTIREEIPVSQLGERIGKWGEEMGNFSGSWEDWKRLHTGWVVLMAFFRVCALLGIWLW
ncbi:hypothetical protein QBC35DRAFT_451391 [Podospora australis]|uniref:Uncharacterized protein n=1 Tax=Podospora australis TaxID=1536484 RepID=A0AAN7AIA0_9PEZI|nr:hypothetical protein QBC35DRAFT_451391 [Podospora australis]